jgi:SAM-dependent methyltransferase
VSASSYTDANRRWWNASAGLHAKSAFYDLDGFVAGRRTGLHPTEPDELGDVTGKSLVQLQCHIGVETLAWARLGAARVVGLDFASEAIAEARALAKRCGLEDRATFIEANVYDAPSALAGHTPFDVVYVSVGALLWLPSIRRWAESVAAVVAKGGLLYVREAHPILRAVEREDERIVVKNRYFEHAEPSRWEQVGTYADPDAILPTNVTYEWNRGLAEILQALLDVGFAVELIREHRDAEWQALPHMIRGDDGLYRLPSDESETLPLTFSLRARNVR